MRPPIRRFAPIGAITLVITSVAATAFLAMAQDGSPPICSTSPSIVVGEGPYLVENDSAMKRMMNDMTVAPTGDVDLDFVCDDGATPSRGDRYGRCGPSPRSKPANQAASPGNHRHPTAGDHSHAAGRGPTTADNLPAPTQSQPLSAASYANARD